MEFAIKYDVADSVYWDNNQNEYYNVININTILVCRKWLAAERNRKYVYSAETQAALPTVLQMRLHT
jgi:hypothetical protein